MSYTIRLESKPCEHCGRCGDEPACPEPTYNLAPIFHFALTGSELPSAAVSAFERVILRRPVDAPTDLNLLTGTSGRDSEPWLATAIDRLEDPEHRGMLLALQPDNGWGTLPDAIQVLRKLRADAIEFPSNVWRVG